jgi:AAA ATPase domain
MTWAPRMTGLGSPRGAHSPVVHREPMPSAAAKEDAVPVRESARPFVGRQGEIKALQVELAAARSGHPRLVLVEGPAGMGKTAVLDHFLANVSDLTVLRATGEQWEAFVAFGIVDQLMRTAGVSNARLLASRDRSLPAEEPVGVGARILEVRIWSRRLPWPSSSTMRTGRTWTRSGRFCSSRVGSSESGC